MIQSVKPPETYADLALLVVGLSNIVRLQGDQIDMEKRERQKLMDRVSSIERRLDERH